VRLASYGSASQQYYMTYVYILQSLQHLDRYYVGVTADLRARLTKHNAGEVSHTSKYAP
jgi:predicted GIY-YIG superfamily endonuclease